jgi:hypothetical protein
VELSLKTFKNELSQTGHYLVVREMPARTYCFTKGFMHYDLISGYVTAFLKIIY